MKFVLICFLVTICGGMTLAGLKAYIEYSYGSTDIPILLCSSLPM